MKARLSQVDGNTYKKLVKFNKTHPKYILPMQLALFAAGFDSPQIHKQAETVLNDIGYLAEGNLILEIESHVYNKQYLAIPGLRYIDPIFFSNWRFCQCFLR